MSTINDGGPAFPVQPSPGYEGYEGMTLRDYFAANAMRELLSFENHPAFYNRQAEHAFLMAEAMLKARENK